jgi:hypothetical protein
MKTIEEMSDIIELQTWATSKPATLSALTDQLGSALDEEDRAEAEKIAQNVLDEFMRRQELLKGSYPFKSDGLKLELDHTEPASTTYLFCLGLSLLPSTEIDAEQRSVQFETTVMNAARSFFGGHALRIGAPWRTQEIPEYSVLLDKVVELIPNLGKKMVNTAPGGGDAGWDVLIVKNFCDNLYPRFIALGNCATGRSDWIRKGMETQPTLFWSFFQSDHRSVFITFFAVPFAMTEGDRLRKLSNSCLTLDRFRICEHAPTTPLPEIATWVEGQRAHALEIPLS